LAFIWRFFREIQARQIGDYLLQAGMPWLVWRFPANVCFKEHATNPPAFSGVKLLSL
jgi:hypothetical protein